MGYTCMEGDDYCKCIHSVFHGLSCRSFMPAVLKSTAFSLYTQFLVQAIAAVYLCGLITLTPAAAAEGASADGRSSRPLAEDLFFLYDHRIMQKIGAPHPEMTPFSALHEQLQRQDDHGYCFVAIGCWGGPPPQSSLQGNNSNLIRDLIRNGVYLDDAGISIHGQGSTAKGGGITRAPFLNDVPSDSAKAEVSLPIRFVLAAGDNMYMDGVQNVWDTRFFTTFEDFYGGDWESDKDQTDLVPWLVALGNHDYRGNHTAQVEYTFRGPKERKAYQTHWESVLGKLSDTNSLFARRGKREMLERLRRRAVSGRWYLPHLYYAIQVSKDMVVVALDTIGQHRCEAHLGRKPTKETRAELFNVSDADCTTADEQKRQVEKWLLEEYADVPFKIVVGHYPVMANGPHPNYKWLAEWLVPLLEKSGAAMYVNADNHYLQVSQQRGVFYVNSGGGGGQDGLLHYQLPGKSWLENASLFQKVVGGASVHCTVYPKAYRSEPSEGGPTLQVPVGRVLKHFVVGNDGEILFSFSNERNVALPLNIVSSNASGPLSFFDVFVCGAKLLTHRLRVYMTRMGGCGLAAAPVMVWLLSVFWAWRRRCTREVPSDQNRSCCPTKKTE